MNNLFEILELNGLTLQMLNELSYKSQLVISLKRDLRYFDRGVHIYFQKSGLHYPIEIQFNTFYDRQFNNWLHKFIYKKNYSSDIGKILRYNYEKGLIRDEECFKEKLEDVLRNC